MKKTQVFVCLSMVLISFLYATAYSKKFNKPFIIQQQNTVPVVKIINPKNKAVVNAASPVNYSITVSDKEDGDSKYDEINVKEVLLEVQYVSDTSALTKMMSESVQKDMAGLAAIRTSNCFNCHNFNSKLIGPSFNDIGKKYASNAANTALLQKHILEGSTGVWGNVSMPSHPELNKEQAANIVQWILQITTDNNTDYYVGTTGTFQIRSNKKGAYLLTGSYTDHGVENNAAQQLKGQDRIIIYSK
ncbi:c-type cytochrome [Ilyomonas limi]|uniref:C-type cytochrome n=1 Tax=Ilyomonas limi TaxID=2575867 RepID=A0A4V5UVH9_9BACT|nr:c-type cytochrome [Ilyomonas limi]TKK71583.1 c-type cytochrome [Ilyomonas limi]